MEQYTPVGCTVLVVGQDSCIAPRTLRLAEAI